MIHGREANPAVVDRLEHLLGAVAVPCVHHDQRDPIEKPVDEQDQNVAAELHRVMDVDELIRLPDALDVERSVTDVETRVRSAGR